MRAGTIVALVLVACADRRPAEAPPPPLAIPPLSGSAPSSPTVNRRAPPSIVFDEIRFAVNGEEVALPWRVTTLHRLLGEPTRLLHMASDVHVYDDLGVVLFEGTGTGIVGSVSVFFAPKDWEFSPKTMFAGALRVRGFDVDRRTTGSMLVKSAPLQWEEGEYKGTRSAHYAGGTLELFRNEETDAIENVRVYVRGDD